MAHASTKGDIPRREFHGSKAYFGRFASRMCRSAQYLDQEYPYIDYGTNEGGNDSGGDPIRASVMRPLNNKIPPIINGIPVSGR